MRMASWRVASFVVNLVFGVERVGFGMLGAFNRVGAR